MPNRFRRVMVCLSTALLCWQAVLAPLAHATAFHSPAAHAAATAGSAPLHEAAAHEAMAHEVREEVVASPCHGVTEAGQAPSGVHHAEKVSPDPDVPQFDCCQSLGCECACAHASALAVDAVSGLPLIPEAPAIVGPASPVQAVRVAELFRPPI